MSNQAHDRKSVLVTGATGQQGGAVARLLLSRGHRVRALTRDTASAAAVSLEDLGAELVQGRMEDEHAILRASHGIDAVFCVTDPFGDGGVDSEVRQGMAVIEAASVAGVGFLAYSSVANADRGTGVPHFDSKYEVERHLAASGVPHVILAPGGFFENALSKGQLRAMRSGFYSPTPQPASGLHHQVAVANIADMAVLALEDTGRFVGRRIDLAPDVHSGARWPKSSRGPSDTRSGMSRCPRRSWDGSMPTCKPCSDGLPSMDFKCIPLP